MNKCLQPSRECINQVNGISQTLGYCLGEGSSPCKWLVQESQRQKKLVYLSAPYSKGDPVVNVHNVCLVADKLLDMGYIPVVPHLSLFWHFLSPKPYIMWLQVDLAILERCDILLRLDGASRGSDMEVAHAKELGIRVVYSLKELE